MSAQQVHLLVLIHGMWGNPGHLASMHRVFTEHRVKPALEDSDGVQLHVMLPETNKEDSTYDGIDWGGERVATEIFEEIERLESEGKKVIRFSVTGYSLGGLLARYVVGILHQRKVFETITPMNFNTIATPHIGLLVYPSMISKIFSFLGPKLLSRTGEQFYGVDKWSKNGRSIIEVMADPDRIFYQGLSLFKHIRIYANAINDVTVPYITAAIESEDVFIDHKTTGLEVEYDETYKPIMKSWTIPDVPPPPVKKPTPGSLAWFKSYSPPLPPRLQLAFPFNIAVIALLPLLFPTFLSLAIIRLSLASRSSRSRIKLLESEDPSTARERLVHVFGELEREMEGMVVDYYDQSGAPAETPSPSPPPETGSSQPLESSSSTSHPAADKNKPIITPMQHKIIPWLNALPGLKKERVFIPNVRNAHATVIARDVQNFEFHRIGEGVLRHWADAFIL
ncbi:DUF676-domain-containing protein [Artomyces pyxidatus]|uniref:DUF676-domain-containing protein n=1 Tax=Artomyces pyxidatus TaxID=48021 RepID=A0ACB8SRZ4_9AGAM|nr:DUF676-domain-containing protein [Artomyces pyxidatus]